MDTTDTNADFSYCPTLQDILENNRCAGSTKHFESLPAASTKENLREIRRLMLANKPHRTMEVGMAYGASALAFASSHRDNGRLADQQHVCIDPFQNTVWDRSGVLNIAKAGLSSYVHVIHQMSHGALPDLVKQGASFGMIYVDGSHLFEDVFIDYYYSVRLLEPDGLLLFDDSSDRHVAKVIAFISSNALGLIRQSTGTSVLKNCARRLLRRTQLTVFKKVGSAERPWDSSFVPF